MLELSIPKSIATSEAGLNDNSPSLCTEVLLWFQIVRRRKLDGGVVEKLASRPAAPWFMSCLEAELGIKCDDAYKLSDSTCACILIDLKSMMAKKLCIEMLISKEQE